MTGITLIKNERGLTTHVVFDFGKHKEKVRELLEDLKDIETLERLSQEERTGDVDIQDLRKELIKMGAQDKDLKEVPNI